MEDRTDALARLWAWFAEHQFRGYSPLYERIAESVSTDVTTLELCRLAPPEAHLPPVLLGAVHYLLLGDLDHPLADVYTGRSPADPGPLFLELCRDHHDELAALLDVRRVQTNDCGRSALLGPALTWVSLRLPGPLALIDVGASAGLNLIADRYRFDYGGHGATGPAGSPVRIECAVVGGDPLIAPTLPAFAWRAGLDRSPVDLGNPDDARWLLACVWPDTGRLARTEASIRLAQDRLPTVHAGDAVEDLPRLLDGLESGLSAVVINTWSFSYLDRGQRLDYVAALTEASRRRPVAWLAADDGSVLADLAEFPDAAPADHALGAVLFETDGDRAAGQMLAGVHQHGAWMDWVADSA